MGKGPRRVLFVALTAVFLSCALAQTALAQAASAGGLSVSVGTSDNDPGLHDSFYYGVRVTNGGGSPVSGAVLEMTFPPSFRSEGTVPPSGCMVVPLGLACPLGSLAAGEIRELYFPGHFDGLDDGATIATVRDASSAVTVQVERQDNDGDDDDGGRRHRRAGPGSGPPADLSVSLTDSPDPSPVGSPQACGDNIEYEVEVTNQGPETATNVSFTLQITNGLIECHTGGDFTCGQAGSTVTCTANGDVAPGESISHKFYVQPSGPGTTSATAEVDSSTHDPNPGNNSDTESTTVTPND